MSNNNNNNKEEKSLINTLIHYIMRTRTKKRETTSLRIDHNLLEEFYDTCKRLRLLVRGHYNVALEGLIQNFIEEYQDTPLIIQTTLLTPEQKKQIPTLNIAQKLELNIIKKDLTNLLNSFEKKEAHPTFLESKLREVLPKAIKVYDETRDLELETLMDKVQKYV